jgi:mycothiol synthase
MDCSYRIRNYHAEDYAKLIRLIVQSEKLTKENYIFPMGLKESIIGRKNFRPEEGLFLAEKDKNVFGYVNAIPELDIDRAILSCLVHPFHRRIGLGTMLVNSAIDYALSKGASIAHVNILEDNIVAKKFLKKLDFKFVRPFSILRLDLSKTHLKHISQKLKIRTLKSGEEEKFTQLQNRSFADTWGYNQNTINDISNRFSLPEFSIKNIIVGCDMNEMVGYCWMQIYHDEIGDGLEDKLRACIYMLGVDPKHRGKGFGKMLLLEGLRLLKNKGIQIVELNVDSKNEVACGLYRSQGFKVWKTSLWYEKVLN